MINIGFTGTQDGMTDGQMQMVGSVLEKYIAAGEKLFACHHGDCIGADKNFHDICSELHLAIILHPPIDDSKRAFCKSNNILPKKEYLDRNKDIVDMSDMLFACPSSKTEELRSGTWSTIRYARKKNKPVIIFYPDATIEMERL